MDLSVCIVTLNACDYLRECLNSIVTNPPSLSYEVIVVDNGSQDGIGEMLATEFSAVKLVKNQQNLGYTLPMNQALKLAQGKYLLQLNPDTLVKPYAFDRLFNFMEAHPEVGICTPKVLNRDGTLQKQCRRSAARPWDAITYMTGLSRLFPKSPFFARYLQTFQDENEVNPVEAVSGSCMLIRREVVDQIGYLDERFFAYQEDSDFCFRAGQAGWQITYVPQAQIIHYGGQGGSRSQPYRSVFEWHRSYYRYYRKNLARDYIFLFNWFFYGLIFIKLGVALGLTLIRRDKYAGSKKP